MKHKAASTTGTRKSRKSSAKPSHHSRKSTHREARGDKEEHAPARTVKKLPLPRTRAVSSHHAARPRGKYADADMPISELQFMARAKGIPFGGLSKDRLVKKINDY